MNICIAGGRDFIDYKKMELSILSYITENYNMRFLKEECSIVSGAARGADTLGERFGRTYCKHIIRCPAEWEKFGKSAGYRRNIDMAKIADIVFVFWDSVSKGTQHMITISKQLNKEVVIFNY
jgi:hypothetical protein